MYFTQGKDFVMVCSDTQAAQSVISIKHDEDKIVPIDSHKMFGIAGEAGDRVNFSEYVIANVKLYAMRNSTELSTSSVAHFTRGELAKALRSVGAAGVLIYSDLPVHGHDKRQHKGMCVHSKWGCPQPTNKKFDISTFID